MINAIFNPTIGCSDNVQWMVVAAFVVAVGSYLTAVWVIIDAWRSME